MSVHFASKKDDWETPQPFFDHLNEEFLFRMDVCATPDNSKLPVFLTPEENALELPWISVAWMNPPYGRVIARWVKKALDETHRGVTVVCLLPARTDTKWWHDYVMNAAEIRLVKGRLKFGGHVNSAPFPSAVVIFRPEYNGIPRFSSFLTHGII